MRLKQGQKSALQEWVAAGLESGEINSKASQFDPPFSVSRAQVDYYRKTRKVSLSEIKQANDFDALTTGLALKAERVKKLDLLARLMENDLFTGGLWIDEVKMIGSGFSQERVEFESFNAAEVAQYRGVLDDIAKEVGDRSQRTELTGKDGGDVTLRVIYDGK